MRRFFLALGAIPVLGTLLSFSRRTHWVFRLWDFPRVQIAVVAAAAAAGLRLFRRSRADDAIIAACGATVLYQISRIKTYTPMVRPTVLRAEKEDPDNRVVLLISNVLMENEEHDRVIDAIRSNDPDVVLLVEVDDRWNRALDAVAHEYPHTLRKPLNNYYGMVLFSKLPLVKPRVDFLVQEDIPSIHTGVRLRSGVVVQLHCLHPRPPEPIRDEPSSPRDAELVIVGRAIGAKKAQEPTIVAGDLNDVAWSSTSELFVRLSGLLDPRTGRGFYNSYNAKNPLFRYPLDHVFHSVHFELVRLRRLPSVGSDHFPILIELQYDRDGKRKQEPSHRKRGDEKKADETLQQEAHDKATGYDRPRGE